MVRLTPELIQQSMQYLNPCRDRELNLRGKNTEIIHFLIHWSNVTLTLHLCLGYRIPMIENLGATLDQFDSLDLSDNDIRKLDGFPLLKRLSTLLLNHNAIVWDILLFKLHAYLLYPCLIENCVFLCRRIGDNLQQFIPNLQTLVLTGNMIQELGDINPLSTLPNLKILSLLQNPVAHKPHYREYVIFKLQALKVLDFRKIKLKVITYSICKNDCGCKVRL